MAKCLSMLTRVDAAGAAALLVEFHCAVNNGTVPFAVTYTWDFTLTAAANQAALKTAIINAALPKAGTTLLAADILLPQFG